MSKSNCFGATLPKPDGCDEPDVFIDERLMLDIDYIISNPHAVEALSDLNLPGLKKPPPTNMAKKSSVPRSLTPSDRHFRVPITPRKGIKTMTTPVRECNLLPATPEQTQQRLSRPNTPRSGIKTCATPIRRPHSCGPTSSDNHQPRKLQRVRCLTNGSLTLNNSEADNGTVIANKAVVQQRSRSVTMSRQDSGFYSSESSGSLQRPCSKDTKVKTQANLPVHPSVRPQADGKEESPMLNRFLADVKISQELRRNRVARKSTTTQPQSPNRFASSKYRTAQLNLPAIAAACGNNGSFLEQSQYNNYNKSYSTETGTVIRNMCAMSSLDSSTSATQVSVIPITAMPRRARVHFLSRKMRQVGKYLNRLGGKDSDVKTLAFL